MTTYARPFEPMFAIARNANATSRPYAVTAERGQDVLLASALAEMPEGYSRVELYYRDSLGLAGYIGKDSITGDYRLVLAAPARLQPYPFERIPHDTNGNGRVVLHWTELLHPEGPGISGSGTVQYAKVCKLASKVGGRKYNTKQYPGFIVFQSSGGVLNLTGHLDRIINEAHTKENQA